jgi:hypothetical protein
MLSIVVLRILCSVQVQRIRTAATLAMSTYGILASKSSLATLGGLGYFARQQRDLQSRQGRWEAKARVLTACGDGRQLVAVWKTAQDGQWRLQVVECSVAGAVCCWRWGQRKMRGSSWTVLRV